MIHNGCYIKWKNFEAFEGEMLGGIYRLGGSKNLEDCAHHCSKNNLCQTFTFDSSTEKCYGTSGSKLRNKTCDVTCTRIDGARVEVPGEHLVVTCDADIVTRSIPITEGPAKFSVQYSTTTTTTATPSTTEGLNNEDSTAGLMKQSPNALRHHISDSCAGRRRWPLAPHNGRPSGDRAETSPGGHRAGCPSGEE